MSSAGHLANSPRISRPNVGGCREHDALTHAAFANRMRDEVDMDRLAGALMTVVDDTMQPAHASLGLRRTEAPKSEAAERWTVRAFDKHMNRCTCRSCPFGKAGSSTLPGDDLLRLGRGPAGARAAELAFSRARGQQPGERIV